MVVEAIVDVIVAAVAQDGGGGNHGAAALTAAAQTAHLQNMSIKDVLIRLLTCTIRR